MAPFFLQSKSGVVINGTLQTELTFDGNGVKTNSTGTINVPGLVMSQGSLTIDSPISVIINSSSLILSAIVEPPTLVQYAGGGRGVPGCFLPSPITEGNLIVIVNMDNYIVPGFNTVYRNPIRDTVIVSEGIAISPVSPTLSNRGNACLIMEIANCESGVYTSGAVTNVNDTQSVSLVVSGSLPSLTMIAFDGDDGTPAPPYLPAGVIDVNEPSYNTNLYLIDSTPTISGVINFGCTGMSDIAGYVSGNYSAISSNASAKLSL